MANDLSVVFHCRGLLPGHFSIFTLHIAIHEWSPAWGFFNLQFTLYILQSMNYAGLGLFHGISNVNHPTRENLCPQAAAVNQATQNPFVCQLRNMGTGLAEANAPQRNLPDPELLAYQMI